MRIRGSVVDGKLVVDQPTDLPEGTVVDLVVDDGGDDLSPDEVARLNSTLAASAQQARARQVTDAASVLEALRDR